LEYLAALLVASFVCAAALWLMLRYGVGRLPMDEPNERSLHAHAVPRIGGIALLAGVVAAAAAGLAPFGLALVLALALAAVSFADDLYRLPRATRLTAHLAAAAVFVWYVLSPMHPLELALLWLAVGWITNLYNFMDGSDGLAGGMSVIGFGAYALGAALAGEAGTAALSIAIAGAAAAFLAFNFHPARVFLGDVGSIPLGFFAAALGILGWRDDAWPLWFPVLVFGPFIGDATLTLVKRLVRGERVGVAHRDHYYQRMVRMGLGHRATAWISYAAMLVCAVAALLGRREPPVVQAAAFAAATLALGVLAVWVDVRWARFVRQPPRVA